MNKEIHFGVSTACFMSQKPTEAAKYFSSLLNNPHIPEVKAGVTAAEKLGLGLEIVYRRFANDQITALIKEKGIPVFQIHGPIWYDYFHAAKAGLGEVKRSGVVIDPLISLLAFGTLKSDFVRTLELARRLGTKQIVLHPSGVNILFERGFINLTTGRNLALEPDWRRWNGSTAWVWQPQEAASVARRLDGGICMDISHTIISLNSASVNDLVRVYEEYQQTPKGVKSIHLSVAVPGASPLEMIRENNIGLPLDARHVNDRVLGNIKDFYQHIKSGRFGGPVIVELFSFKGEESIDQRIKAVETTLENLESAYKKKRSLSFQGRPTKKPI
jgi:sugar phosphate isomerase/epimerase